MKRIHIAGLNVKVGPKARQLCAWCGETLIDDDLRNIAVAPKADGSPGDPPGTWEVGALVEVDGSLSSVVPHKDGDKLPAECCAPEAYPPAVDEGPTSGSWDVH